MANHKKAVDGRRVCTDCGLDKDEESFRVRKYDSRYRASICRQCVNIRGHKSAYERVEKLNAIKLASGCVDCGYNKHPVALDFDHLPEFEKSFNVSAKVRRAPWDQILAEVAKCEVVCSNCHRVRTWERANGIRR